MCLSALLNRNDLHHYWRKLFKPASTRAGLESQQKIRYNIALSKDPTIFSVCFQMSGGLSDPAHLCVGS